MNFIIRTRFLSLVPEKENEMKKYILKRLLQLIPILLVITFLSFGMMRLAGSDAVLQKMENTGMIVSQEVMDKADTVFCMAGKSASRRHGNQLYIRESSFSCFYL